MNYKKLGKILGKIMVLEAIMMLAPLAVSVIYKEGTRNFCAQSLTETIYIKKRALR